MRKMAVRSRKKEIYEYILWYVAVNGYSPSYREIGEKVGLNSASTVGKYIKQLEEEGKLTMNDRQKCRSLSAARCIQLPSITTDNTQRIEVEMADGGILCLDCRVLCDDDNRPYVAFSGVMDATRLKGQVCNVIRCGIVPE